MLLFGRQEGRLTCKSSATTVPERSVTSAVMRLFMNVSSDTVTVLLPVAEVVRLPPIFHCSFLWCCGTCFSIAADKQLCLQLCIKACLIRCTLPVVWISLSITVVHTVTVASIVLMAVRVIDCWLTLMCFCSWKYVTVDIVDKWRPTAIDVGWWWYVVPVIKKLFHCYSTISVAKLSDQLCS